MSAERFDEAMGEVSAEYVEKAAGYQAKRKKYGWARWAASAACFAFVAAAALTAMDWRQNRIELSGGSFNVSVRYTDRAPEGGMSSLLVHLTEEELFTHWNTAIFKGTVLEIRNIELNFNGMKFYQAVAEIQVEKVYRGPCAVGDTVPVLLPCPIGNGAWVEDTGVVSQMKVGTTGIFMPNIYDEDSIFEANGARLILTDVAPYGFADGVRYAFLEADAGSGTSLLFDRTSYKGISGAADLDEVEDYIEGMLERLPGPDGAK